MSEYLNENCEASPYEATTKHLCAGAASMKIEHQNGAIEVTHADGSLLMQAKNVKEGTWSKIWELLESCGEVDYRA